MMTQAYLSQRVFSLAEDAQRTAPSENPLYCWYSAKAVEAGVRPNVYAAADGTEVTVTLVSSGPEHGCSWPDIEFVGRAHHVIDGRSPLDVDDDREAKWLEDRGFFNDLGKWIK